MSFETVQETVQDLFESTKAYEIPRNQRKYVWEKRNWSEIYDDIVYALRKNKSHFIGSLVLQTIGKEKGIKRYIIIDGQQRIITLLIMLSCVYYWMKVEEMKDNYEALERFLITRNDDNKPVLKVSTSYQMTFEKMINSLIEIDTKSLNAKSYQQFVLQHAASPYKADEKLKQAYLYFLGRIEQDIKNDAEKQKYLTQLSSTIRDVTIVNISADTQEDAYTIFEILNARGLVLANHELLKNYIMRYIEPESSRDEARENWDNIEQVLGPNIDRFIHHYTIHRFGYSKKDHTLMGSSDYKTIVDNTQREKSKLLLEDLAIKACLYHTIEHPEDVDSKCTKEEKRIFKFMKSSRQQQIKPLLLSLKHQYYIGGITEKNYNEALNHLYYFMICFKIIGDLSTNKLTSIIGKHAKIIEDDCSVQSLQSLRNELMKTIPGEDWLLDKLNTVRWSHHFPQYDDESLKEKAKVILLILEENECGKIPEGSDFTIEQILDDSSSIDNAVIGNLIPLEESLNKECIGKSLREKTIIYQRSSYKTTKELANFIIKNNRTTSEEHDYTFNPASRTDYIKKQIMNNILKDFRS